MACTFTNKAAKEMKERVSKLIGKKAGGLWIGTFHSICFRILRRDSHHLGYTPGFTVMDAEDSLDIVKLIMREMQINPKMLNPRLVKNSISSAKNALVGVDEYAQMARTQRSVTISTVYRKYQARIEEMNSMDFDDLIGKTIRLLSIYTEIAKKYQEQFEYLLVDEYQDINPSQHRLIQLLAKSGNIMIVGDDDQSIYAFRGATPGIMLDFDSDFPGVETIMLDVNYRSTGSVISVADQLVKRNRKRVSKELIANAGEGEKVYLHRGIEPSDEAYYVAKEIQKEHDDGRDYSDFAIIYRTNVQSRSFEDALISRGIPYQLIGGTRFYQRKEIKDVLAYLRLVVNPADSQSFKRALTYPSKGIGVTTLARMELMTAEFKITFEESLARLIKEGKLNKVAKGNAGKFLELINELRTSADTESAPKVVEMLIKKLGIIENLRSDGTDDNEARATNIEEFLNLSTEFINFSEEQGLEAFLASVSLIADIDQSDPDADKVLMTTIHQVKGLEFPVVFLCGLEEGTLPHSRSLDSEEDIEEERRLAYVGITRAKEVLHLSYVTNRHIHGVPKVCTPSRFIKEIQDNSRIETRGLVGGIKTNGIISPVGGYVKKKSREIVKVSPGDEIIHKAWGKGKIVSVDGEQAQVEFGSVGAKLLNLRYAPIEKD